MELVMFLLRKIILPIAYNMAAILPIKDDLVVFADSRRNSVPDSMKLLYKEMQDRNMDVRSFFRDFRKGSLLASLIHNIRFMLAYARAKYVFISDYYVPVYSCNKRPETIVVQTWHACGALKKWGYSTLKTKFGVSEEHVKKYPIHTNYTYATVSSAEISKHYAEAYNMTDRMDAIMATGISRTDVFFNQDFLKEASGEFYEKYPVAKDKKIILYAPTFRGTANEPETENPIDMEAFYEKLKDEYVLVFKLHPFLRDGFEIPEHMSDFALDVSSTMSIDQMITVADICITDYSTVLFEFSLFERPMVFFPYDYEDYVTWRGFYYDYFDMMPGPIVMDSKHLLETILTTPEWFDKQKVQAFRDKFMSACDGHATDRIIDLVTKGDK